LWAFFILPETVKTPYIKGISGFLPLLRRQQSGRQNGLKIALNQASSTTTAKTLKNSEPPLKIPPYTESTKKIKAEPPPNQNEPLPRKTAPLQIGDKVAPRWMM